MVPYYGPIRTDDDASVTSAGSVPSLEAVPEPRDLGSDFSLIREANAVNTAVMPPPLPAWAEAMIGMQTAVAVQRGVAGIGLPGRRFEDNEISDSFSRPRGSGINSAAVAVGDLPGRALIKLWFYQNYLPVMEGYPDTLDEVSHPHRGVFIYDSASIVNHILSYVDGDSVGVAESSQVRAKEKFG